MVFSHPTGSLGGFPTGPSPVPQSALLYSLAMAGPAAGKLVNYGNCGSEGRQQDTPRVQGCGHRFLGLFQPGQKSTSSLGAGRGSLYARALLRVPCLLTQLMSLPCTYAREYEYLPLPNEESGAQGGWATSLRGSKNQSQKCLLSCLTHHINF